MVHMHGALSACMLVWNNQLHDLISWKEITSDTLKNFFSSGMSGMIPSSCKRKWKLITHEFRDMYHSEESGYVTLNFQPSGC